MLSPQDAKVIGECLNATASGPFFPDWEFDTLMGVNREDFSKIAARWPDVDLLDERVRDAVSNSLLNLSGYPIDQEEDWSEYVSVPREALDGIRLRFEQTSTAV